MTSLSTGETYTYDANGNMITRVEGGVTYAQTFDAENRLISVTVNGHDTTQFVYDGDGNLVKKINPDGSKTIYVGGIYEVDKSSGGAVTRTVTYYPGGAMRINSTLYYVLKDHLGSASVVTDSTGAVVGEQRYYPFGETRFTTGTIYTDKLFTGQREMTGLGIYHYGARFYSPKLGRFLSADTVVPGAANPQAFNRYSYVLNNPLRYTDPTGHWKEDGCTRDCEDTNTTPGCGGLGQQSCGGGGGGGGGGGNGGGGNNGGNGGDGGKPLPMPDPTPDSGGNDECPNWNVCASGISSGAMQNYFDANNDFINIMAWGGVAASYISYNFSNAVSQGYITGASLALIASYVTVAVLDPLPIEEIAAGVALGVIMWSGVAALGASDLQSINYAIQQTGAYDNGGSITADWDGATITGTNGSMTIDTWIPFSAPVSILLWSIPSPGIVP